jgi:hypothetical protein
VGVGRGITGGRGAVPGNDAQAGERVKSRGPVGTAGQTACKPQQIPDPGVRPLNVVAGRSRHVVVVPVGVRVICHFRLGSHTADATNNLENRRALFADGCGTARQALQRPTA